MLIDLLGQTKREIALLLKRAGSQTLAALAQALDVTREAVRVQVQEMTRDGWVAPESRARRQRKAGRPATAYGLTAAGEHLFPKDYEALAAHLLDALAEDAEPGRLRGVLAALTERRMAPLRPRVEGLPLESRLDVLRSTYADGDPFMALERSGGDWLLVERNCPFLNVALRRPALCSTTVNLLTRLLGVRVVREERFQDGAGRCVFRVHAGEPSALPGFEFEPAVAATPACDEP